MPRTLTLDAIARALNAPLTGDGSVEITRLVHPKDHAQPGDLALAMDKKIFPLLAEKNIRIAVVAEDAPTDQLDAAIKVRRPRLALAKLTNLFAEPAFPAPTSIHPTAIVAASAQIGADVSIGPFCVVGDHAVIGDGTILQSHVTIEPHAKIGAHSLIRANVCIGAHVRIGARCIIHFNTSVGADGFSYVTPEVGSVESAKATGRIEATNSQGMLRIASLGAVIVGDDVEIGANSSIDNGTIAPTRVGRGTKIDNQVQIGHNVQVGEDCLICGQVGIAGSVEIGDRVVLGGHCGVADHIKIGDDAMAIGYSAIGGNVPPRTLVGGVPAQPKDKMFEQVAMVKRLKTYVKRINELEEKLMALELKTKND